MINKLKRRFLILGTVFMFILMSVLVLIMNLVNYREVASESDRVLDMLCRPDEAFIEDQGFPSIEELLGIIPAGMSIEVPYESRYFSAVASKEGNMIYADLSRIVSVDEDSAKEYIITALESGKDRGFVGNFRYSKTEQTNGTRIVFLDCGRRLDQFRSFLWISVIVGLCGCFIVFLAFAFTAGKIVAPIAEGYEKQKRFISDAGHEIKTPLTIINANVDLMELDGEKEELSEIREQTKRLTELTNDLVMLSKMEEAEHTLQKIDFPLSDLVSETAASFRAPASANGLELTADVAPNITAKGAPDSIRRLVSVLLENAVKYSPEGGRIRLCLTQHRKQAILTVENDSAERINESDLAHIFDRFYRADASRNSSTGGHGIGLSIAKAIVESHGGSISASTATGKDFKVTASLPL
ncbi:MAG: HAMP domain-containing histidine kinase [Clostridia bacterium]|nr:HAMP domain-containing histidine kinase [Clostridia bacterium]